jgi:hypothetical protein
MRIEISRRQAKLAGTSIARSQMGLLEKSWDYCFRLGLKVPTSDLEEKRL